MSVLSLKAADTAPWGTKLLSNINLELDAGEALGVIGPNGAGKTSLLQTMIGDMVLTQGTHRLFGEPVAHWKPRLKAQRVASLPQFSLLNFPYTVEEVIGLGRTPHSTGAKTDRRILQQVMTATDTVHLQSRVYTQLSGGEKQRVQLARVFAQIWHQDGHAHRLLLLDEPTVALDLGHQQLILQSLKQLANSGCAVVVVSHDFNLIAAMSDRVTALREGSQHAYGKPGAVLTRTLFRDVFNIEVNIMTHPTNSRPVVISL